MVVKIRHCILTKALEQSAEVEIVWRFKKLSIEMKLQVVYGQ